MDISAHHDKPASGHLAFQRTYKKIQDKYYWPNMLKEIKDYYYANNAHRLPTSENKSQRNQN